MADRALFKDVLFELFKDADNCDRVIYQMMRAYDIFSRQVKVFTKMSTKNQYYICEAAARIAIASSDRIIREVSIFKDKGKHSPNEEEYSLEYGYEDPEKMHIGSEDVMMRPY